MYIYIYIYIYILYIYIYIQCVKETRIGNDEKGTNTRLMDIGGCLPRTIIDKIESRTAEHRDSAACPRPRGGSLCPKPTTTGHRALPAFNASRFTNAIAARRMENTRGIIFGAHELYSNRRILEKKNLISLEKESEMKGVVRFEKCPISIASFDF